MIYAMSINDPCLPTDCTSVDDYVKCMSMNTAKEGDLEIYVATMALARPIRMYQNSEGILPGDRDILVLCLHSNAIRYVHQRPLLTN